MALNVVLSMLRDVFLVASAGCCFGFGLFACFMTVCRLALEHPNIAAAFAEIAKHPSFDRDFEFYVERYAYLWDFCFRVAFIAGVLITVISLLEITRICVDSITEGVKSARARINELQAEQNVADSLDSLDKTLYDESMTDIQAMVKESGVLPRERWNRFERILLRGSNTLSSSSLMQLFDWPVLQAPWGQFQRDVLEHHEPTADPTRPPQWRIAQAPSRIRTAASNTWRLLTGHEPADSSHDMGLPNARLLPNLLLPALHPQ
ncbi:hypothetical protein F5144DRAFT_628096 [Chaetomium tenue]|uniref:Uncharacterized protein n=1 Tax=Chaetomium tenue TaxID=1854479 RepID=A0ACB7PG44_9PEZI|nr:hypothetical protein F5144DRAFT_628096 [Chaetomium globosum]